MSIDALERVWRTNESIASTAVIAGAIDKAAHRFYEHHGFLPLPKHENRLYLPMKVVGNLLAE